MVVKRIGNWYELKLDGIKYNVFIQKNEDKVSCEPDTSIVFNEEMSEMINDSDIIEKVVEKMGDVDWEHDIWVDWNE